MHYKHKQDLLLIRLSEGEEIFPTLTNLLTQLNVEEGFIVSAIGQLKRFKLGYFKEKGDFQPTYYEKPHELLALTGSITKNEDYVYHLHAQLADAQKTVYGGHLIGGMVSVTCEILFQKTNFGFIRIKDEETGLMALKP
ncbi:MAG: DUF296 domain-containing protein [Candidatus Altiarchaeales archaeon]|nr:DUF296 domain-containing protein [Candidatus Altiarchaeales archaeon]